jgi:signal transduction histidine kinase
VLENLLSNAIKYTDRGHVLIGCVLLPGLIRIDVRDTGRGIPLDAQDRIFDEFYQAPGSDAPTGSGLGLAIVRSLIDRLPDHRVTLASRPGWGSRFSIYLPTGTE